MAAGKLCAIDALASSAPTAALAVPSLPRPTLLPAQAAKLGEIKEAVQPLTVASAVGSGHHHAGSKYTAVQRKLTE